MNLHTMSVTHSASFDLYPLLVEQDMRDWGHAHWHTGMSGVGLVGRIYLDLMSNINKAVFFWRPGYFQHTAKIRIVLIHNGSCSPKVILKNSKGNAMYGVWYFGIDTTQDSQLRNTRPQKRGLSIMYSRMA